MSGTNGNGHGAGARITLDEVATMLDGGDRVDKLAAHTARTTGEITGLIERQTEAMISLIRAQAEIITALGHRLALCEAEIEDLKTPGRGLH